MRYRLSNDVYLYEPSFNWYPYDYVTLTLVNLLKILTIFNMKNQHLPFCEGFIHVGLFILFTTCLISIAIEFLEGLMVLAQWGYLFLMNAISSSCLFYDRLKLIWDSDWLYSVRYMYYHNLETLIRCPFVWKCLKKQTFETNKQKRSALFVIMSKNWIFFLSNQMGSQNSW